MFLLALAMLAPTQWMTNDDYPPEALRHRHDGQVSVAYIFDPRGRVFDCHVTVSSGWPELDNATCALILQRGRMKSVTDDAGQPIGAMGRVRMNWVLPGTQPKPATPQPSDSEIDVAALPKNLKSPVAEFDLIISEDGAVERCKVAEQSGTGSNALDAAACKVLAGTVFPKALDPSGKPMRYFRLWTVAFRTAPAAASPQP
jgi:TonB family protein